MYKRNIWIGHHYTQSQCVWFGIHFILYPISKGVEFTSWAVQPIRLELALLPSWNIFLYQVTEKAIDLRDLSINCVEPRHRIFGSNFATKLDFKRCELYYLGSDLQIQNLCCQSLKNPCILCSQQSLHKGIWHRVGL